MHTPILLPPSVSASHFPLALVKYDMFLSWVLNWTITSPITYMAHVICAQLSLNDSGSLSTACCKICIVLFPIFLLWCANMFVSSSNILFQSGLRPSHCSKLLMYSFSTVLSSSSMRSSLPWVTSQSGSGVPFCFRSAAFPGVVEASFRVVRLLHIQAIVWICDILNSFRYGLRNISPVSPPSPLHLFPIIGLTGGLPALDVQHFTYTQVPYCQPYPCLYPQLILRVCSLT